MKSSFIQPDPPQGHDPEEEFYPDETLHQVHDPVRRERAEPWEKQTQMPFFLLIIFGLLCAWGGFYLSRYCANFDFFIYDYTWQPGAEKSQAPKEWVPLVEGEKLFRNKCQQCHQKDGQGVPGTYPSLVGSPWLLETQTRPIRILLKGLQGPLEVNGHTYNGSMPAFEQQLDDRRIAAVLTYVRQAWGNQAEAIQADTVKSIREWVGSRSEAWSAQELLQIPPDLPTHQTDPNPENPQLSVSSLSENL